VSSLDGVARFERVSPILCVSDVPASIAYYVGKLGFRHGFAWGEPTSFAGVTRDGVEVMFCRDGQGSPGTWFTIWVDDVDGLYAELVERGAEIRQPPISLAWGVREMNVADPDGPRIRFSTETHEHGHDVELPFGPERAE
jgi:uncharacterized glyoxalase superfamily protein PhnB